MRLTIMTAGSQGDVQPFVVLGSALQQAGYTVRMVVPVNFSDLVARHNLNFHPIQADFQQLIQGESGRKLVGSGQNFLTTMREGNRLMAATAWQMVSDLWEGSQDTEVIINHVGLSVVAQTIAEKLGIPFINAALQPYAPTRAFPHPLWPSRKSLGGFYNRLTGKLVNRLTWQIFQSPTNRLRTEKLAMPRQTVGGFQHVMQTAPLLNAFSPHVAAPPADWGSHIHTTGYWFDDETSDWTPPSELTAFLDAGSPPVYIGFGSMASQNPTETYQIVVDALKISGQRGILSAGWGGMETGHLPDTILGIDFVPHTWLFPRMAAVVHHGGAGTTGISLRSGVPTLIVPFTLDQFYWGEQVAALGVGPTPIPRKKLTAENLAAAIQQAVTDSGMRSRAQALGQRICAEHGVQNAVGIIQKLTHQTRRT